MPDGGDASAEAQRAPLLLPYSTGDADTAEVVGVDEMLRRYAGEFGAWQLRHFLLTSLAWALNAFHTLVVVFADREPAGPGRSGSTVSEWGLVGGERFKVGLAQSAFFVGSMIGAGIFGHLSDTLLGRKGTLTITCSMNAAFGFLTALSPSFPFYAALRFLTGLSTGGVGLSAFVLTTEPVGASRRGAVAMSTFYFFSLGTVALSAGAYFIRSWRSLYVASSLPSLVFVVAVLPFVAESPRWHLVHRDVPAAMNTMRSIATTNNKHVPDNLFLALDCTNQEYQKKKKAAASIITVARSPATRSRLALSVAINLLTSFVYYGLSLNVKNLSTNLYASVTLNAVAEIPAYALTALLARRCGRRPLIVSTAWSAAAFCAAAGLAAGAARTACGMMGIFAVTATFNLLFMYAAELFPTAVRNAALGCVTQAGQTGAVVAPMVVVLGRNWPFAVFGSCAAVGGLLGLALPETLNCPLYETMEGLERG